MSDFRHFSDKTPTELTILTIRRKQSPRKSIREAKDTTKPYANAKGSIWVLEVEKDTHPKGPASPQVKRVYLSAINLPMGKYRKGRSFNKSLLIAQDLVKNMKGQPQREWNTVRRIEI